MRFYKELTLHSKHISIAALFFINLAFMTTLSASPVRGVISLDVLRNEIYNIIKDKADQLPDIIDHVVTVGFLINARNEVIILDVNGDSVPACEYVKQVLNYKKVKYNQERQLTRYSIKIHLVNKK